METSQNHDASPSAASTTSATADGAGGGVDGDLLAPVHEWPVDNAAVVAVLPRGPVASVGNTGRSFRIASITKILVGYAALIALEEGSIDLDQPAGPEGSTVRHLLAHASGLPFRGAEPITAPGRRRIYSNTGFERLGETMAEATRMPVAAYLHEAVLAPLGMSATELRSSPAYGARSTADDLARFAGELLAPRLLAPETFAAATREQFPGLAGVIPGLGRYSPNPWGLGFELKGPKSPHWTAPDGSPDTFGHFGGSGTFLWVDPDRQVALLGLTDREFDEWAPPLWSSLSSSVLAALSPTP